MVKEEILAVHKMNLENFLKKLELWEPLLKGQIKCAVCDGVITIENIGFIIPSGEEIILCCSNIECIYKLKNTQAASESEDES